MADVTGLRCSFSPTRMCSARPDLGITWATSLRRTFCAEALSGCTRRFERRSGLKRPPARSLLRSSLRRVKEEVISASRAVKSFGSSTTEGSLLEEEDEDEVLASSRAALAPFFWRGWVVVKRRWVVFEVEGVVS